MPSFGARLRAQREERDIPLSQIAYDTKIKLTLLEGLERDDVSCWPQGLFRRAWVRSYARAIGLDPEATVREFVTLYPDPAEQVPEPEPTGLQKALAIAMMGSRPLPKPSRTALIARMVAATKEGPEVRGCEGPKVEVAAITEPEVVATPVVEEVLELGTDRPSDPRTLEPSDLCALAEVCASIARAADWNELTPALAEAASLVRAEGMTIWTWDQRFNALSPAWAHGYADELVARMPRVTRESDNALAAAWREARVVVVSATPGSTGAVVAPMVTPDGCLGVVALELAETRETDQLIQAIATILAAQLASVMGVEACYTGVASESRAS
ncbi:MAG: helix-turn-helix domain-containing protein [Vicinamibacterales bacterium]